MYNKINIIDTGIGIIYLISMIFLLSISDNYVPPLEERWLYTAQMILVTVLLVIRIMLSFEKKKEYLWFKVLVWISMLSMIPHAVFGILALL